MSKWKQTVPGIAYLALPYTGAYGPECPRYRRECSFRIANAVAARLIEGGEVVFSPISHSHPIADYMIEFALDCAFWMEYDERMMAMCDRLYVLRIKDWKKSNGVKHEIAWFQKRDMPVFLMQIDPDTGSLSREVLQKVNGCKPHIVIEQLRLFPHFPLDK